MLPEMWADITVVVVTERITVSSPEFPIMYLETLENSPLRFVTTTTITLDLRKVANFVDRTNPDRQYREYIYFMRNYKILNIYYSSYR